MDSLLANGRHSAMDVGLLLSGLSVLRARYRNWITHQEAEDYGLTDNFHFSRQFRGEPFLKCLARHEHYLFMHLGVQQGMRILEVGCGTGARCRELAQFADVTVVGIDTDEGNIQQARRYATMAGLSARVQFIQMGTNGECDALSDDSFDAAFSVESIAAFSQFDVVCAQISRVLRPGTKFACYTWCMTNVWDAESAEHSKARHRIQDTIRPGGDLVNVPPMSVAQSTVESAGFQVEHFEDLATRPDDVRWYNVLEKADRDHWQRPLSGAWWITGSSTSSLRNPAARAILQAGKAKLFSPMVLIVARRL
ncbi:uncharacterized protein FIBRA_04199 [Fibroporia radiculosa]|uniref:Methyltransferase type 11 domain-containing protein n=1 Tax=Fibroporia radiculosa TaxID=599839 RepID=J4HWE5_9APHY|nr:uncharacterized protein FIBRA_04199 [Fibroporia radiculosa]CCM02122.1 predicted protein [Fibroporia radiculosa]